MKQSISVITIAITLHLISISSVAQSDLRPLKIADKVPEKVWQLIPKKKSTELVILDFWSTACASCMQAFPKMERLQTEFGGKLQIVLINALETDAEIKSRFNKINSNRPKDKWITTPASLHALNNSIFQKVFPHIAVPHHVWVDKTGKVIAITDGENATEENVQRELKKGGIQLEYKVDFLEDQRLYIGEDLDVKVSQFEQWSLFKKGKIKGIKSVMGPRGLRGFGMRNGSIIEIIRLAITLLSGSNEFKFAQDATRTVFEVGDIDKLGWKYKWNKTKEEKEAWENENLYTYDILLPGLEVAEDKLALPKQMIYDFNRYSNYTCMVEKKKVKCLIIVRTSQKDKIKSSGGKSVISYGDNSDSLIIRNTYLSSLLSEIKKMDSIKVPAFDETKYTERVDIEFEKFPQNVSDLRRVLQRYDLDLIEAERELEMFVVRDKKVKQ